MSNTLFRKVLVLVIIFSFVGASVVPIISGNVEENKGIVTIMSTSQSDDNSAISCTNTDWWTMFRHDLRHSGYSTSEAPDTNNVLWSFNTGYPADSSPAISDGKVYIGSYYDFYCLNAYTGHRIWSYDIGTDCSPAVSGGKVYIGLGWDMYCLNADNGNEIWSYETHDVVDSSPAVSAGKVYFGSNDDKVYCLNADNGNEIWTYTTGDPVVLSSPAISGGKVYIGSNDGKVYCLNADNGNKIWSFTTAGGVWSSPAVSGGKVYIGSDDDNELYNGKVYCLNADNGNEIWNYTTNGYMWSSPAISGGKVYIGSNDCNVYCLNADNGNKIWSYITDIFGYVVSSPAVADGKVYFGSNDGKVYCLNADNGNEIWSYTTGGMMWSSPAVCDGKVYIGAGDGKVYCFGSDSGNLPPTVDITQPAEGSTVSGTIAIKGTASDSDGIVDLVEVRIDSGTWESCTGTTSWVKSWDTTTVVDGSHTLYARSLDDDGAYSNSDSVTVNVNNEGNNPPTVQITSPSGGTTVLGIINIQGTASDSDGIVDLVEVRIDSGTWESCTGTTSWVKSWDTTTVVDGSHTLYARSLDDDGAYSTSDSVTVNVNNGDNSPPNKPILSGETLGRVGQSYVYNAVTTDPDGDKVEYWFDWDDGQTSGWLGLYNSGDVCEKSHIWDVEGSYSLKVKARDIYGAESDWSDPLSVSMPKNKPFTDRPFLNFLKNILERFPLFARLLRLL